MRDYESVLKSMRICLAVDRDSNCLSQCFGCDYISHEDHVMDMVRDTADAIEELLAELERYRHAAFVIGETCVDESKSHISPEDAIKKIRENIYYSRQIPLAEPPKEVE